MTMRERQLDLLFHALSDTTRRGILMQVRGQDRSVNEIAAQFTISLPAVSKPLNVLEQAGLINRRKRGRMRICHADPEQLNTATEWLEFYQGFWSENLENLKQFIEQGTQFPTDESKR